MPMKPVSRVSRLVPAALLLGLSACAGAGSDDGAYAAPVWTRGFCASIDWRRQGASDAARFADAERRFAALERACGIHMRVPKDAYMAGFAAAR